MVTMWSIRPYSGPPVPERISVAEQRAILSDTGLLVQRPGVPGAVVVDSSGSLVLAISSASEVRFVRGASVPSTAEVLAPAPPGVAWPAIGRIGHDGLGWTDWRHESLDGSVLGTGEAGSAKGREWGLFAGAAMTAGADRFTLDDVVRPESDEERARRERRRFFRSERLAGSALGHRFIATDGREAGRLLWTGAVQPQHHERPYEWRLEWAADRPDDAVLVGAAACSLRFMAFVGTMLSMS